MLTRQSELDKLESRQSYLETKILEVQQEILGKEKELFTESHQCREEIINAEEDVDYFLRKFSAYCCMERQEYEDCISKRRDFSETSSLDYYHVKIVRLYAQLDELKFNREKIDREDFLEKEYNCFEQLASIKSMLEFGRIDAERILLGLKVLEEYHFEFEKVCESQESQAAFRKYWMAQSRILDKKSTEIDYKLKIESLYLKYVYYVKRLEYIESRLQQLNKKCASMLGSSRILLRKNYWGNLELLTKDARIARCTKKIGKNRKVIGWESAIL